MRFAKHISVILVLIMAVFTFAVETTYNQAVTAEDVQGGIHYEGTITFAESANGDIYYSQWMAIGGADKSAYGFLYAVCSEVGTEDVNIIIEYSNDRYLWDAGTTDTDLDAVGTTAVRDSIGVIAGTACKKYESYSYCRLKFVAGQDIGETVVTWTLDFKKAIELFRQSVAGKGNRKTS